MIYIIINHTVLNYNLILQSLIFCCPSGDCFPLQRNWEMLKRRTSRSTPLWTRPWASSIVSKEDLEQEKASSLPDTLITFGFFVSAHLILLFFWSLFLFFLLLEDGLTKPTRKMWCLSMFKKYFNLSGALKLHYSSPQKIPSDFRNNLLWYS